MPKSIKVIELFAGVGGFRLGLEGYRGKSSTSKYTVPLTNKIPYEITYSNQWEPSTVKQHANEVYTKRFGSDGHFEIPIEDLNGKMLPDKCDLLVGGFPCPDFSVGALLKYSKGLDGKKGELWFQITRLLKELKKKKKAPQYLLFENVDRMLSSPASNPGKDFESILASLNELDYSVEWKVINAADYGFPQRRKRVFVFCYSKQSPIYDYYTGKSVEELITHKGVISSSFPVKIKASNYEIDFDTDRKSKFKSSGIMIDGSISEYNSQPLYNEKYTSLKNIIYKGRIDEEFYISSLELYKWKMTKSAKKIPRERNGFSYIWSEGAIPFPDNTQLPSRTIITSEGGRSASRTKHVITDSKNRFRRLVPVELERLNMFPSHFTDICGLTNSKRAYLMGNALVVGIIEKIGSSLSKLLIRKS